MDENFIIRRDGVNEDFVSVWVLQCFGVGSVCDRRWSDRDAR